MCGTFSIKVPSIIQIIEMGSYERLTSIHLDIHHRYLGYGLMGVGVIIAVIDIINGARRK